MTVFLVQGHNLVSCGLYFKLIKKKIIEPQGTKKLFA